MATHTAMITTHPPATHTCAGRQVALACGDKIKADLGSPTHAVWDSFVYIPSSCVVVLVLVTQSKQRLLALTNTQQDPDSIKGREL